MFLNVRKMQAFGMRFERKPVLPEYFPQIEPCQTCSSVPFHNQLIYNGRVLRGVCVVSPVCQVVLNIRTKDSALDMDALEKIARQMDMQLGSACELSSAQSTIKVRISLNQTGQDWFYTLTAAGVPREQMTAARVVVDKVGKKIFDIKEEPRFRDEDAARLNSEFTLML
jgi:hypothetical protein